MFTQFGQGYALVIGVGYVEEPGLNNVREITAADARAVAEVLRDPKRCAYPEAQVTSLIDTDATKARILKALDALAMTEPQATVVIFYSGHGGLTSAGSFYLTTSDTRLGGTQPMPGITQAELLEKLKAIKARRLLAFFHACHSGASTPVAFGEDQPDTPSLPGTTNPPEDTVVDLLETGEGRVIINSSRPEQSSYASQNTKPLSIFTHALVAGLSGGAVANRYGFISLFDLYDYLYDTVKQEALRIYRMQEPELNISRGVGRFAVALYPQATNTSPIDFEAFSPEAPQLPREGVNVFDLRIDTGGGGVVAGNLNTGGDYTGRDRIHYGDNVQGAKAGGHNVQVGDISKATGVGVGVNVSVNVSQGIGGEDLQRLFANVYQRIESRAEDPRIDKDELKDTVQKVQKEAAKGEQASTDKIERWLKTLADVAPDILRLTVAALTNPVAGVAEALRVVARRVQEQKSGA